MGELQGRISFLFAANQFLLCNALLFFDCFIFSTQQKKWQKKKMRCTKKGVGWSFNDSQCPSFWEIEFFLHSFLFWTHSLNFEKIQRKEFWSSFQSESFSIFQNLSFISFSLLAFKNLFGLFLSGFVFCNFSKEFCFFVFFLARREKQHGRWTKFTQ